MEFERKLIGGSEKNCTVKLLEIFLVHLLFVPISFCYLLQIIVEQVLEKVSHVVLNCFSFSPCFCFYSEPATGERKNGSAVAEAVAR